MRRLYIRLLLATLFLGGCVASPLHAQSDAADDKRTIHVEGEATVQVEPDQATIRFGVVTQADTPQAARAQNGEASSAVLQTIRDAGLPDDQIRMEQLRLRPNRVYDEQRERRVEEGFVAIRVVRATVNDLDRVPVLVAAVVEAGANRLQSVYYGLRDRTSARNEALSEAARSARSKAEQLTGALGVQLGTVHTIREQQFSFPRAFQTSRDSFAKMERAAPNADPDAYAPGTIDVQARVGVVFMLQE